MSGAPELQHIPGARGRWSIRGARRLQPSGTTPWLLSVCRRVAAAAAAAIVLGSSSALACPMCFGAEETSMIDGTKLGILMMLGITFTVQGAFFGFFFYLRRRAKRVAEMDLDHEWSELQKVSKPS
jgi:hypothetical protein